MPSVVATPFPTRGQVLVEANFADVPGAMFICMEAVTGFGTDDEVRRSLHSYVCYDSNGCLALSCGQALFWDTEISCGVPTRYCATVTNANGVTITTASPPIILDTFTRVFANGWDTATSGQTWAITSGAAADHSVNGTQGVHTTTVVNTIYEDEIEAGTPNVRFYSDVGIPVVPTGASITLRQEVRRTNSNNYYSMLVDIATTGTVSVSFVKVVGGVQTLGPTTAIGTHTAGTRWSFVTQVWGNQIQLTGWKLVDPMPSTPTITTTDTDLTTGTKVALRSRRETGNTNGTQAITWDNVMVTDVCADLPDVEVCTEDFTIACDGCFRLGDPLRPCADVRVCLCADGTCGGAGGLFFAGMTTDSYADNSGNMLPVNGVYPIHITRNRRSATGSFTIVPTTFTDRDNLLNLLSTGNILYWRGPAEFGTGNRYLAVGEVGVTPPLADLTIQPRIMDLPFMVAKAPVGPSFGVCGARIEDLSDVYPTWDALIAAGLTYADLLRGNASTTPAGLATWASINAGFADWNALAAGETDWTDVVDGD